MVTKIQNTVSTCVRTYRPLNTHVEPFIIKQSHQPEGTKGAVRKNTWGHDHTSHSSSRIKETHRHSQLFSQSQSNQGKINIRNTTDKARHNTIYHPVKLKTSILQYTCSMGKNGDKKSKHPSRQKPPAIDEWIKPAIALGIALLAYQFFKGLNSEVSSYHSVFKFFLLPKWVIVISPSLNISFAMYF